MKETVKLGSVLSDIAMGPFGSNLKVENFQEHGVPVIRGKNLSGFYVSDENLVFVSPEKAAELSRSLARPGEIVVTHRGTLGQVSLIPANGKYPAYLVSQSQMRLAVDPRLADARFITYWMRSRLGQLTLSAFATQTGVPAIAQPTTSLSAYPISLPSLSSQSAIASILGSLDDKIAANSTAIEKALLLQSAVWVNGTKDVGSVPLVCVSEPILGGTPPRKDEASWGGGYKWASVADMTASPRSHLLNTAETITSLAVGKKRFEPLPAGSVLLSARGTVGRVVSLVEPSSFNQSAYGFKIAPGFEAAFRLAVTSAIDELRAKSYGAVFSTITKSQINEASVPAVFETADLPLHYQLNSLESLIVALEKENITLAKTRDELLPLLMNGKISVREAEQEATSAGADIPSEEIEA